MSEPRMTGIKGFLVDFPTANGRIVSTILLIWFTGIVVAVRLALGEAFPDGYDTWLWVLVILAGVDSAHVVGKRLSDFRYKAAGTPAVETGGPTTVVQGAPAAGAAPASSTTVTTHAAPAAPVLTRESAQAAADAYAAAPEAARPAGIDPPGQGD